MLSWEVGCFIAIGVLSTVGQALLYWLLRGWWAPAVANLISLSVLTVLNTEANRRLTFRHSTTSPVRAHLGAGGLFVLGYLVTSGAVLWFKWLDPGASPAAETAVLATASVAVTCVRFAVLRLAVFMRPPRPYPLTRANPDMSNSTHLQSVSATPTPVGTSPSARSLPAWAAPAALGAVLALSAVLYGWALGSLGWGNSYYSAAVKSMGTSWTNFLFGSFDPAGVVTVDKPWPPCGHR